MYSPEADFEMVSEWWKAQGWPPVNPLLLSSFGLIVLVDGVPMAVGWLYLTTSGWAWIEWLVVNPAGPMKTRRQALKCLLERLGEEAEHFGALAIFSSVKSNGLVRLYASCGFKAMETGMTNVVKIICQSPSRPESEQSSPEESPPPAQSPPVLWRLMPPETD